MTGGSWRHWDLDRLIDYAQKSFNLHRHNTGLDIEYQAPQVPFACLQLPPDRILSVSKFICLLSWAELVDWIFTSRTWPPQRHLRRPRFPSSSRDFWTWSLATDGIKHLQASESFRWWRRPQATGLHIDDVTWQILSKFKWRKREKKERKRKKKMGQQYSSRCCCSTCQWARLLAS